MTPLSQAETNRSPFAPVEQQRLYGKGKRGDCVAACVASVFGLTLDTLSAQGIGPGAGFQQVAKWTGEWRLGLEYREQDFCTNFRVVEGGGCGGEQDRWEYDLPPEDHRWWAPTMGLWIAHVESPRGRLLDGPYCGMPVQHAVVMRGATLLWDPHPQRDDGIGRVLGMGWWVAREPGLSWKHDPTWQPRELTGLTPETEDAA